MSVSSIIVTGTFTGLFFLSSCRQKTELVHPVEEAITESVYASGTIKSRGQYQLYPSVSGTIKNILVKEGDTVKKGMGLLVIENEKARLNTENAALAADYSDAINNTDKLRELQAAIDIAKTRLINDSTLYQRQQNLWAQGIGTRNELDQRELAWRHSGSNYESAVLRYNETRRQINFSSKQAKKNLQLSAQQQNDFVVKSESDGRVFRILKEKGESVNPQNPVAVIGAANDFMLELAVDEYDIARILIGQKILVTLDSYKGEVFEAEVEKINPIMDERSRSFIIEAIFNRRPEVLYPNLSAEANIIIQTREKAITIPRNFLLEDSFVLTENKEKRKVQTGLKDYKKVEILSGLDTADKIMKPGK